MERCPVCGADTPVGSSFCLACGVDLDGTTAAFEAIADAGETPREEDLSVTDVPVLVVRGGMEVGERFYLDRPELTLGRDPACDVFLNDVTVSRAHARLTVRGSVVTVEDAGSLNGTYVNDAIVAQAELKNGDTVQIGRFRMVFLDGEVHGGSSRS